jgi:hypothetical protein
MIATMKISTMKSSKVYSLALLTIAALALTGCGDGGLELNGKLFDALGVSEAAQRSAKNEPKLRERTGLVMPPNANRLPEPGTGASSEPDLSTQISDPERRKALAAAEQARLHKAYCSGEMNWKERVGNREAAAKAPTSPYGPCSVLGEALKQ